MKLFILSIYQTSALQIRGLQWGARVKCIVTYAGEGECGKYLTLDSYFNVQPVLLLLKLG